MSQERSTRPRPGPSKPPASKPKRKQTAATEDEVSDRDDPMQTPEVEVVIVDPPKSRNGKVATKGKGKAVNEPTKKHAQPQEVEEIVDEDEDELASRAAPTASKRSAGDTLARENARLKKQLESSKDRIDELSKQLEDAYRVRHTEPEEALARERERYDALIRAKDLEIAQQAEMLERKEWLASEGKTSVLYLVTRETADAEKRSAEAQVEYWKDATDKVKAQLEAKDEQIEALTHRVSDLEYEVKIEKERVAKAARTAGQHNQTAPARGGGARGPHSALGSEDPKHGELIKFYEDMTNTLVTDIKSQEPRYFHHDDWVFTCIYTYSTADGGTKRSLNFLLRFAYEPIEGTEPDNVQSPSELEKRVQYTPLNLDKESPDFSEALDFLKECFTFGREQLPVFLSSLVSNMKNACEPPGQEEEESMEQD
ncbi:hypothetical protein MKEN_01211500 [Mycena kentingensis (nom. inval.)]|nr:hypothetical protein MKEN_01211500 [Mycena kentingensis (nom. inval.)]